MKIADPLELFKELGIELEMDCGVGVGEYNNRRVRYLESAGLFQVNDKDFDRWCNSVDLEFEVWLPKGQRKLKRWCEEIVSQQVEVHKPANFFN